MPARCQIARCILHAATIVLASVTAAAAQETSTRDARASSKPFYLRDIQIGDVTLPFSPMTVVVMIISLFFLGSIFNSPKSTAKASHILIDGKDAQAKLEKMKKDIKGDYAKFQSLAKNFSKCPSGKADGGRLGTFKPG